MGFDIAHDSLQETAFIVAVVGVSLSIIATSLRFVATKRSGRKPSWEDWFAVLATVFFIFYVVPLLYKSSSHWCFPVLRIMNGRSVLKLHKEDIIKITKVYKPYGSLSRPFVQCVWFLGIVQLMWSIATYVIHYFECTPPARLWNTKLEGTCINSPAFLAGGETPNSLIDFALVGLAIWVVQSLQMKTIVKLKLSTLFAIGGLAGVLGFVKIGQGFGAMNAQKVELMDPIWAVVQQACSIICCCAPIYKPLLPQLGLWDKLLSFGSQTFGSRRSSGSRSKSEAQASLNEAAKSDASVGRIWKQNPTHWVQLDERSASSSPVRQEPYGGMREEV
ncbi:Satratoxin biosynthesis SC1 cluster protein [Lachnellula occidentalis]|uniref:Satratoxin biosynthesis SC1 cluster protein n=1 Tax=Lachnellula occidentalis TaxID=215460 RepID=A0A8H8UH68_9HELO|nr:Satratoxin biosynthesis SC1 cluster protein [Lachnellula occidentalis]